MIFYQFTTNIVTTEQLKASIFKGNNYPVIQHFSLRNSYGDHTAEDFLCIVESKRKALDNPDGHAFLSLELLPEPTLDMNKLIDLAEQVADAINRYYDYDLYIASLIYDNDDNCRRTVILISDMENPCPHPAQLQYSLILWKKFCRKLCLNIHWNQLHIMHCICSTVTQKTLFLMMVSFICAVLFFKHPKITVHFLKK